MLFCNEQFPLFFEGAVTGVYCIVFPDGSMYVGSTTNLHRRKFSHLSQLRLRTHHTKKLLLAYKNYAFPLWLCKRTETIEEAQDLEQEWALLLNREGKLLNTSLNTKVSFKGMTHTDETKRKLSEKAKDRRPSEATRKRMADAIRGRKLSEETKQKIAAIKLGIPAKKHVACILRKFNNERSRSVSIDGVFYISEAAAGRALSVDTKTIRNRIESSSPKYQNWKHTR